MPDALGTGLELTRDCLTAKSARQISAVVTCAGFDKNTTNNDVAVESNEARIPVN